MGENSFTDLQEELVNRLTNTGISKNIAKILVFIAGKEETKSKELEYALDLRQPEVSIAIQKLRERGWVTKRDIKKEGKGRPVHGYRLNKPIEKIVDDIESRERERINEIEDNVENIKQLVESIY